MNEVLAGVFPDRLDPMVWIGDGYLHFLDPRPGEITIKRIARGLAAAPRFAGHTFYRVTGEWTIYTVAEHSWSMWKIAHDLGWPRYIRLQALLHDAPEGLGLADIMRPVKAQLSGYDPMETMLWNAVAQEFGVPEEIDPRVQLLDDQMLATEKRDLCADSPPWPHMPPPLSETIKPLGSARAAYERFLDAALEEGILV